ncbi:multidrug efflux RND transporter permease subunit [Billgrantia pellis]|uniref:Efflux pump membrane transporter n=1 Tax=Billgrantia pellis TaxID=2606936 RepID=A0A7V7G0K0_9GAMM|nr:multidrug efflux RND transporter permease subunit [Halomonas pellis]KAA0012975.1 multidrug efflux RND transporter permease subunit [Halomonas pellis]
MSRFFLDRPNFAWVLAIFILLAGLLAIPSLPVSQFPNVVPPQISVSASYPGASATVVADSVTNVIEEELNGARGMLYFESSSEAGRSQITVTFDTDINPDMAQVDVQNRLKNAEARLPGSVVQQGIQVEQISGSEFMIYSLLADEGAGLGPVDLSDYAARTVNNEIRRVKGVGRVQFYSSEAAMRVWLNPHQLLGYGLSVEDVNQAIASQNIQVPAGSFGARPSASGQELTATIALQGTMQSVEEFGRIVLKANQDGSMVRLSDVARLEIGLMDYMFGSREDGRESVAAGVQLAPGANAIETAEAVRGRLEELSSNFPEGISYSVPYDTSGFVEASIKKVLATLLQAMVLVFLSIYLFLQNLRYTLVPTIVVPICLAGTLAVMYALGFSVNMMTMFGMVLVIGILVDDAIVIIENVERIMVEEGLPPKEATIKAMGQVRSAIIGAVLVMAAVFFPMAFMGGSVGVIYQQFSLTMAVSVLFSGFLALTFTPALCATLLKPVTKGVHAEKKGLFGWFNHCFGQLTDRFTWLSSQLVRRTARCMLLYAALVGVMGFLYVQLPESFVPVEDQGYYYVDIQLPPGAAYPRTEATIEEVEDFIVSQEATGSSLFVLGYSFSGTGSNAALGFPMLKDWSERGEGATAADMVTAVNERFSGHQDGVITAVEPPPIEGLGTAGGFSFRLQDRGGLGRDALVQARDELLEKANASPIIAYAMTEGLEDAPQLRVHVDREQAQALGVSFETISSIISTAYGSAIVNEFPNDGRMQRVVVQADAHYRMTPESLLTLNVLNASGDLVPVSSFATTSWENGPIQISRYNGYPAFKISGDANPGHSSGEAIAELERIADELPLGIGYEWTALSYQEKLAGAQAPKLFALAILVVFLVLVALYESWKIPVAVMLIVPVGVMGGVLMMTLVGLPNDVYFKVGLITIVGLSSKNAILIVEFAKSLHEQGMSLIDAAVEAVRLRFRPIIMTSLSFLLGVSPLIIATGAGAASQRAIGFGLVGGMLATILLGVLFVPIFFVWVLSLFSKRNDAASENTLEEIRS